MDPHGVEGTVAKVPSRKWMERLSRKMCIGVGSIAATCKAPRTGAEVKAWGIPHTTTQAIALDQAIRRAQREHRDPIQAILDAEDGRLIFCGKVSDISRRTTEGFLRGTAKFDGIDDWRGRSLDLAFQNEWAVGWLDGVARVMRPDLICVLDSVSGEAIGTETLRYRQRVTVGPRSVGFRLPELARVFGGPQLTTTDAAVRLGMLGLGDRVADLDEGFARAVCAEAARRLEEAADRMKTEAAPVPLLAVGGGAFLVPDAIPGISVVLRPAHAAVANAVGAAIAQVSGEADQVFQGLTRPEALREAERIACAWAVEAGANSDSLVLVGVEDLSIAYLPGGALRVRATRRGRDRIGLSLDAITAMPRGASPGQPS